MPLTHMYCNVHGYDAEGPSDVELSLLDCSSIAAGVDCADTDADEDENENWVHIHCCNTD